MRCEINMKSGLIGLQLESYMFNYLHYCRVTLIGLLKLFCPIFFFALSCNSSAEIHEQVQAAVNWQIPSNECKQIRFLRYQPANRSQAGVIGHGGSTNTTIEDSAGTPTVFGVDHYQIDRYERKKKRWESCVSNYKSELLEQFEILKNSAQYGLTQQQAVTIVGKLAEIQAAVISPDGIANVD